MSDAWAQAGAETSAGKSPTAFSHTQAARSALAAALAAPTLGRGHHTEEVEGMNDALDAAIASLGQEGQPSPGIQPSPGMRVGVGAGEAAGSASTNPNPSLRGGARAYEDAYAMKRKELMESCAVVASEDPALEQALEIARVMTDLGVSPSADSYSSLLRCCADAVISQVSVI